MDLEAAIPTSRHWTEGGRNSNLPARGEGAIPTSRHQWRSMRQEYRKKKAADHTEENLQYMLGARFLTESNVTKQILNYSQGRKAKDRPEKKEVKKERKSVFTESDFRKFEREYFGAS
ncbi:hypothetical protein chiPu_0010482 [Chiloscyllium punctatum]|uniref:Active regulator of SIRT1 n=1 Tax=Chiloscyllium punctatum TaxID=137246 RepID=A0A401SNQ7_CHIPU|nr:hypothetical protein [Chiloscyllium punctatum]